MIRVNKKNKNKNIAYGHSLYLPPRETINKILALFKLKVKETPLIGLTYLSLYHRLQKYSMGNAEWNLSLYDDMNTIRGIIQGL